jgi:hypothetical protein
MMVFSLVVAVALIPGADVPKDNTETVPAEIKGEWDISFATNGENTMTTSQCPKLTIGDKEAEWSRLPYLIGHKGKGAITVSPSKEPTTIELKVGDKVYKGIYRYRAARPNGKYDNLDILFGEAGEDFPKGFAKDRMDLPNDFKGVLLLVERKKK